MSGSKLGRPPRDKVLYHQKVLEERLEFGERSAVKSVFGVDKRRYSLNLVMERLQETSEIAIHACILTMNLWKRLRELLFVLIQRALQMPAWCRELGGDKLACNIVCRGEFENGYCSVDSKHSNKPIHKEYDLHDP